MLRNKMSLKTVTTVAIIFMFLQGFRVEALGLVEMISNYAKIAKNTGVPTTEAPKNNSVSTTMPFETTTESVPDYQDFDELQEEDRSLKQSSQTDTMLKYFNGLISLLALMYKFNGSLGKVKPSNLHFKNQNEPRDKSSFKKDKDTGKHFKEAQDRFEFPQKKFRQKENMNDNAIDQEFQPLENYPPYNPLSANSAETYQQNDKKTSYDADFMQYDLTKNFITDYGSNVDVQQSYSYEIPYESPKPAKTPAYDITNDESMSYNNNIHPVYHPWMTKITTEDKANEESLYQSWKSKHQPEVTQPHIEKYKPWKPETPDTKTKAGDSDHRQPWKDKPFDIPIYHHDFKDSPAPDDHHFEYHEVEHPADEDRVSKKPYSYYFLGRKLWYIPLLFSVYFIIYIGALVLKSVARHKIQFPEKIWNLHDEHFVAGKHRRHRKVDEITENYEKAFEKMNNKFM